MKKYLLITAALLLLSVSMGMTYGFIYELCDIDLFPILYAGNTMSAIGFLMLIFSPVVWIVKKILG